MVTDDDRLLQTIKTNLEELASLTIKVGVQGNEAAEQYGDGKGVTVAEVAVFNEYGTGRIPARPFMRETIEQTDNWAAESAKVHNAVIDGKDPYEVAELLGQKAASDVQDTIYDGDFVPNSPATIKKKGSSKPLIDTGQLVGSITYVVEE